MPHGEQTRLVLLLGTEPEHFHQALLVEHRLGNRAADQAGHATTATAAAISDRSMPSMLIRNGPFAQAHGQVHQTGSTHWPGGVDFHARPQSHQDRAGMAADHAATMAISACWSKPSCRVHHPAIVNQNSLRQSTGLVSSPCHTSASATKNILNPRHPALCPASCRMRRRARAPRGEGVVPSAAALREAAAAAAQGMVV